MVLVLEEDDGRGADLPDNLVVVGLHVDVLVGELAIVVGGGRELTVVGSGEIFILSHLKVGGEGWEDEKSA